MSRLSAHDLISLVLNQDSWSSWDSAPSRAGISEQYSAELAAAAERSGVDQPVLTGGARLHGRRIGVLVGEFGFLAGHSRDLRSRVPTALSHRNRTNWRPTSRLCDATHSTPIQSDTPSPLARSCLLSPFHPGPPRRSHSSAPAHVPLPPIQAHAFAVQSIFLVLIPFPFTPLADRGAGLS